MEKLFYYTGVIVWIIPILVIIIQLMAIIWKRIKKSNNIIFHWLSIMYCRLTFDMNNLEPILSVSKKAIEDRLQALKNLNIRKFEQRFLEEYLKNVKVKEQESVFG